MHQATGLWPSLGSHKGGRDDAYPNANSNWEIEPLTLQEYEPNHRQAELGPGTLDDSITQK